MNIKKIICSSLFSIIVAASCFSQAQLVYDFNTGAFVNDKKNIVDGKPIGLKSGAFATLKIINVNTFRWKVEITGQNINYVTPIPSELQTLFRLPDQTADQKKTEEASAGASVAANQMSNLSDKIKDANVISISASDADQNLQSKMEVLTDVCDEYLDIIKSIANIKFTRVQLINLSKQKWVSFEQMRDNLPALLSETDMHNTYNEFSTYYGKVQKAYNEAIAAAKTVADEKRADNNVAASEKKKADDDVKTIIDAKTTIQKSNYLLAEDDLLKIIEDVTVLQDAMDNKSYFEVVSPPIQMHGDFVEFNIVTTPTRTNDLMPYEFGKTFPVQVPIKGGLKVDFSVGPIISFGGNAKDEKYFTQDGATAGTVVLKKQDNKNAITPSLAAMMHFYPRRWPWNDFPVGLMMGIGAGFKNEGSVDANLMGGISTILGTQQKIMFSIGVSYLRVDRLKEPEFALGKEYAADKIAIGAVTEKVFKPSFFISLSFNLTKTEIN